MEESAKTVALIGAGPAGTAMGLALAEAGFGVKAIFSRSSDKAAQALKSLKGLKNPAEAKIFTNAVEAASQGRIVVVAVPDKAIAEVAGEIAGGRGFRTGGLAIHLSGSLPSSALEPAHLCGARIGSMHPIKSFAGSEQDKDFKGVYFGMEGEEKAVEEMEEIAALLGAASFRIRTEDKPFYHAATSVVSNFTVSIFHLGMAIMESIGIPRKTSSPALAYLLKGTVENISTLGVPKALTGPISRGDSRTVASHLDAFKENMKDKLPLYAALGRYTIEVALEKGTLSTEEAEILRSMFARWA